MKKGLSIVLVLLLLFSLSGCRLIKKLVPELPELPGVTAAPSAEPKTEITPDCVAERYEMALTLDTDKNILEGVSNVTVKNATLAKMDKVYFCLFAKAMSDDVTVKAVTNTATGETYEVKDDASVDSAFYVALPEALPEGQSLTLAIRFREHVTDYGDRFSCIATENGKIYSLMMCFPTLATCYDGKWQTHDYFSSGEVVCNAMTDYAVTFTCPADYTVLASGHQTTENGVTTIEAKNVREMCIVASNDMVVDTVESDGITFHFAKLDYEVENKKALDVFYQVAEENAVTAAKMYNEKVGAYLYDELDIIPFSMGSEVGGMEMPGLITYDMFDEAYMDGTTYYAIVTLAHEVAHEWFYCAVGNDQYKEPWLDESFADYFDTYYTDHTVELYGGELSDTTKKLLEAYGAHHMSGDGEPINMPCDRYGDDYIDVYSRGDDFLYRLEQTMGSDTFFTMLQDWYRTNTGKIATGSAFVKKVQEYDNSSEVQALMEEYLDDDYLY